MVPVDKFILQHELVCPQFKPSEYTTVVLEISKIPLIGKY